MTLQVPGVENDDGAMVRSHAQLFRRKSHLTWCTILRTVASARVFKYSLTLNRPTWPELGEIMEWTAPAFEEVCLNCEINSYASAQL